ncbi:hypothetical protein NQ318_018118, partial [Aromia moschata]
SRHKYKSPCKRIFRNSIIFGTKNALEWGAVSHVHSRDESRVKRAESKVSASHLHVVSVAYDSSSNTWRLFTSKFSSPHSDCRLYW